MSEEKIQYAIQLVFYLDEKIHKSGIDAPGAHGILFFMGSLFFKACAALSLRQHTFAFKAFVFAGLHNRKPNIRTQLCTDTVPFFLIIAFNHVIPHS
jgi:hypothetical protein